jgi:hypothetical protein
MHTYSFSMENKILSIDSMTLLSRIATDTKFHMSRDLKGSKRIRSEFAVAKHHVGVPCSGRTHES